MTCKNDFTKMALWKIAKQQMVAGDLRLAIGGILISREVERIADYAKLICSFYIKYETEIENFEYISLLFDLVNKMLNTISLLVDNYEEAQEQKVVNLEMELNNKFKEFNNKMIAKMNEKSNDEKYVTKIVGIIRQLKNLERAGDHLIILRKFSTSFVMEYLVKFQVTLNHKKKSYRNDKIFFYSIGITYSLSVDPVKLFW
jgi:phosphate transport system protein